MEAAPSATRRYDLYLVADSPRLRFSNPNHGVTLSDTDIGWMSDGREDEAALADIASVNLSMSGVGGKPIAECRITFRSGLPLVVTSAGASGRASDEQAGPYRAFVHDLHGRLARRAASVHFMAGYSEARYNGLRISLALLALVCGGGALVALMLAPGLHTLGLLVVAGGLCWPFFQLVQKNAPRAYNPVLPPEDVMP